MTQRKSMNEAQAVDRQAQANDESRFMNRARGTV
jgi:hypothetical protein